ncbi:hypothetical protein H5410_052979 [Solanum commersonii]|uniref:Uncharacterized protein n=1 Tax=Solanum commersonii TaxID=4109 RepID=A0A9J5X5R5_SOLCO|nr:hypothetical protein H5410_052979 [Solanum commersonii]
MEPVVPDSQNGSFSRSNKPRSRTAHFKGAIVHHLFKVKRDSKQLAVTAKTTHFQGQKILGDGKPPILPNFMCYSSLPLLVIRNSNMIFAEIFHRRSLRPSLWNKLALIVKTAHFQSQKNPGAVIHFCQNFSWTSVKTLVMELVGPDG